MNHRKINYLQAMGIQAWASRAPLVTLQTKLMVLTETTPGTLLDDILLAVNIEKSDTIILSVEHWSCDQLKNEINKVNPARILVFGSTIAKSLLGDAQTFEEMRGKIHAYEHYSLMVTYDLMHLMHNPKDKRKVYQDLMKA